MQEEPESGEAVREVVPVPWGPRLAVFFLNVVTVALVLPLAVAAFCCFQSLGLADHHHGSLLPAIVRASFVLGAFQVVLTMTVSMGWLGRRIMDRTAGTGASADARLPRDPLRSISATVFIAGEVYAILQLCVWAFVKFTGIAASTWIWPLWWLHCWAIFFGFRRWMDRRLPR